MIYGIGTDLVALDRVEGLLSRYGERFVERVLMPAERDAFARSSRPVNFLGQRFAAKEACSKAFGLGLRYPATLHQMGLASDPRGKPLLVFGDALAAHAAREGVLGGHVSLTDERGMACAMVVLERADAGGAR
ncbi:MAG: holo-ACP synthase [Rhodocyclaceae bacterium]|jgi:holo-[acyl-carrier protein] synthase|nr:holo-ACP synthase [Rhodocyclaceae bacterium]MCA4903290.1 holo-ACP synthase [Rhodocyclaceae bacterium]